MSFLNKLLFVKSLLRSRLGFLLQLGQLKLATLRLVSAKGGFLRRGGVLNLGDGREAYDFSVNQDHRARLMFFLLFNRGHLAPSEVLLQNGNRRKLHVGARVGGLELDLRVRAEVGTYQRQPGRLAWAKQSSLQGLRWWCQEALLRLVWVGFFVHI